MVIGRAGVNRNRAPRRWYPSRRRNIGTEQRLARRAHLLPIERLLLLYAKRDALSRRRGLALGSPDTRTCWLRITILLHSPPTSPENATRSDLVPDAHDARTLGKCPAWCSTPRTLAVAVLSASVAVTALTVTAVVVATVAIATSLAAALATAFTVTTAEATRADAALPASVALAATATATTATFTAIIAVTPTPPPSPVLDRSPSCERATYRRARRAPRMRFVADVCMLRLFSTSFLGLSAFVVVVNFSLPFLFGRPFFRRL